MYSALRLLRGFRWFCNSFPRNIVLLRRPRALPSLQQVSTQRPHGVLLLRRPRHAMWMWQRLLLFERAWPVRALLQMHPWRGRRAAVWSSGRHRVPDVRHGDVLWGAHQHQTLPGLHPVLWQRGGDPTLYAQLGHTLHGWVVKAKWSDATKYYHCSGWQAPLLWCTRAGHTVLHAVQIHHLIKLLEIKLEKRRSKYIL